MTAEGIGYDHEPVSSTLHQNNLRKIRSNVTLQSLSFGLESGHFQKVSPPKILYTILVSPF
jgi:hypothetical protein